MKIKVWVVTTCIPDRGEKPCMPDVFGSEAAAEAYADEMLRNEWAINGPEDEETGERLLYPGDWREANDQIAKLFDDGSWGEWQITSHEIEVVGAAGPSSPEYLDRFPPEARVHADRAYQDGYEDGVNSAREEGEADPANEPGALIYDGWTVADNDAAVAEGWLIMEGAGWLEIQADDDHANGFAHDGAAIDFVALKARSGSDLHVRALAIHNDGLWERAALEAGWEQGGDGRWHRGREGERGHMVEFNTRGACNRDGIAVQEVR